MAKDKEEGFRGVSDAELKVLELLWDEGPASPNELQERAAAHGTEWAYTTVQTLLHRLYGKQYVTRRKEGVGQIYQATLNRDELLAEHMNDLAHRLCGGAATPLLLSLVQSKRISKSDISRFREILDESEESAKGGRRKKDERSD